LDSDGYDPRMATHLHIDPYSGIAGDMFIGAMLHLGVKLDDLRQALAPLPTVFDYELSASPVLRQGVSGIDFKVRVHDKPRVPPARVMIAAQTMTFSPVGGAAPSPIVIQPHAHRHVGYSEINAMIDMLATADRAKTRARRALKALAEAEALVHQSPVESVHFHEVGAVDSIVDMLGTAVALELLGVEGVTCGPVPISRGFVKCEHGRMPVPPPATAYLMRGMPTFGVDRDVELVTPTGAALLVGVVDTFCPPPAMVLRGVGYGAGDKDFPLVPNHLRLLIGETSSTAGKVI
jgi:uncharacterized protein (TIGR00299 family) protein